MRLPGKAVAASAVLAALLAPAAASAETVTNLADSGAGSLRSAIAAGGTVTFAPGLSGTIVLANQLEIDKNLTIEGPGARALTVSGNDAARVFHVSGTGVEATIRDVTIRDGTVPDAAPIGAGVLADGDAALLRLERVAVVDNEASSASQLPLGGGVAVVDGKLELVDSTVAGNRALAGGGGGGVMVGVPATFEIVNSTIAGNIATVGGGLLSISGPGTIRAATIAGNTAAAAGPAIGASGAPVAVERSLLTGNGPAACAGDVTSGGDNVVDTTCFDTPAASDAIGVTAPVGTLGPNGGPTDTLLPLAGSAAIDHVACTGADQRAVARPQGAACDAGAVENRPARLVASGPLALGSALVGQHSAPATITVTNNGDFDATITGISLAGPNAAEVEPVADPDACSATTVLGAGETCGLKARLAPTSAGAKTATYSVAMGAAGVDVPITGTGLRPALLEFSAPLALGSALVGQHSAAGTSIITNTGDVDAVITAVTLAGPNAAEVEPVADPDACTDATVLAAGATCKLKARLAPTSAGAKTATFSVAMGATVVEVPITGTGESVPPPSSDPGGGGGPPPPTPSADTVLVGTSTKAGKGGKLKLRLRCTAVATDRCAGSLTLKLGKRKLTKAYSIAAGQQGIVTLKLGAGDRRRLARKRSLKSVVTVVTKQPDGTRRTTQQSSFKLRR